MYNEARIPKYILIDPIRVTQILMNFIGNAIKFTSKGKVSILTTWLPNQDSLHPEFKNQKIKSINSNKSTQHLVTYSTEKAQ